jgi:hypothetical protein
MDSSGCRPRVRNSLDEGYRKTHAVMSMTRSHPVWLRNLVNGGEIEISVESDFARIFLPKSRNACRSLWFIRPRTEQEADDWKKSLVH